MAALDLRGCRVNGATQPALALYEEALAAMQLQRGDALDLARQAVREAPAFVAARQLEAELLLCSRDPRDFEAAGWAFAGLRELPQNDRERWHTAAIEAAVDGDYARASSFYDRLVEESPLDAVALHVASTFDYFLGSPEGIRARTARALEDWTPAVPGYHAVLALHAFGLEECGEYGPAEAAARRALDLQPLDLRAHHAVAHVLEMQGRSEEGIRWMGERAGLWDGAGPVTTHQWWHLALHHLQLGRGAFALTIYDKRLRNAETLPELIDASALLWRLDLAGFDVGGRFGPLAGAWAPYAEDAHCAFNDLHAMMAFAGARRFDLAHRLLCAQIRRVARTEVTTNTDMTRLVGLPACRALLLFARGEYAAAEALLRALPPVAHRVGGSHAQRDILQLTRFAAAGRSYRRAA